MDPATIAVIFLHGEADHVALMTTETGVVVASGASEQQAFLNLLNAAGFPAEQKTGFLIAHENIIGL